VDMPLFYSFMKSIVTRKRRVAWDAEGQNGVSQLTEGRPSR
jgi:hypothetical protein